MAFADTIEQVGEAIINLIDSKTAGASGVPVGTVIAYMGTTVPDGYLLMDGRVLSQETYANLYSVVGVSQLPSGATESGGVYTWTDTNGITYSTGTGTDDATHKYKMFAIADMTDGRYLMGSTVAGTRNLTSEIPNIAGAFCASTATHGSSTPPYYTSGCFTESYIATSHFNGGASGGSGYVANFSAADSYNRYKSGVWEVNPLYTSHLPIIKY